MAQVRSLVEKVARSMAPVLVQGESGTGKELVARAIHACSHRADGPFVAVNCSAIPESLLEAEFFGARKGSYTGASVDRDGYFQAARGGTLFLDEIGDMPLELQARLLRVLDERQVTPLGGEETHEVDFQLLSASHRHLPTLVREGRFREDLYYRLSEIVVSIPPLRDRHGDAVLLAHAFNGLTQRLFCTLRADGHEVSLELDIADRRGLGRGDARTCNLSAGGCAARGIFAEMAEANFAQTA